MRVVLKSLTTPTSLLSIGMLLLCIILIVFRMKMPRIIRRVLCCVPLVLCIIHVLCYPLGQLWSYYFFWFGTMYLLAILMILWQFADGKVILWRVSSVAIILFAMVNFVYIPTNMPVKTHLHCYTRSSWTDSFVKTVRTMEKEYVLSDWKEIDYDALLDEFVPRIQEAEQKQDTIELGMILFDFTNRFYDGHIGIDCANSDFVMQLNNKLVGNDYGLSMIPLDDGNVIAVCIEPGGEAAQQGIHTGTLITHWNGIPIQEAKYSYMLPINPSVEQNEEPNRTILLAGQGEETVSVTFIADDGQSKTITLHRIGEYYDRYNSVYSRHQHMVAKDDNFSYKMVSDTCGYLRINAEDLRALQTAYAWIVGEAPFISTRMDEILTDLRSQGMESLVIDIRNNTGGHPQVSSAVAAMFTAESRTYTWYSDEKNTDKLASKVTGNGKWKDLPVVVLVNQNTVSAGDAMAQMLADCENVMLMGMTHTNCSCQNTGGICVLADGYYAILYPTFLEVDEKGNPNIDTDASRKPRIPLDVHIPLDAEAAEMMFTDDSYDHELEYAIKWLLEQR